MVVWNQEDTQGVDGSRSEQDRAELSGSVTFFRSAITSVQFIEGLAELIAQHFADYTLDRLGVSQILEEDSDPELHPVVSNLKGQREDIVSGWNRQLLGKGIDLLADRDSAVQRLKTIVLLEFGRTLHVFDDMEAKLSASAVQVDDLDLAGVKVDHLSSFLNLLRDHPFGLGFRMSFIGEEACIDRALTRVVSYNIPNFVDAYLKVSGVEAVIDRYGIGFFKDTVELVGEQLSDRDKNYLLDGASLGAWLVYNTENGLISTVFQLGIDQSWGVIEERMRGEVDQILKRNVINMNVIGGETCLGLELDSEKIPEREEGETGSIGVVRKLMEVDDWLSLLTFESKQHYGEVEDAIIRDLERFVRVELNRESLEQKLNDPLLAVCIEWIDQCEVEIEWTESQRLHLSFFLNNLILDSPVRHSLGTYPQIDEENPIAKRLEVLQLLGSTGLRVSKEEFFQRADAALAEMTH